MSDATSPTLPKWPPHTLSKYHFFPFYIAVDPVLELVDIQGTKIMKNGVEYISIKKMGLKCTQMKKVILKLENLFQGNKELSTFASVFFFLFFL